MNFIYPFLLLITCYVFACRVLQLVFVVASFESSRSILYTIRLIDIHYHRRDKT